MRGSRKNQPPASGFFSLIGAKQKRPSDVQRIGPAVKKPRLESQDVASTELVSRVETLLASGNLVEAEALIISVLNHIYANATSTASLASFGSLALTRSAGLASSRLPPAYTVGLLVIAKHASGPSLFARPAVLELLYSLLALSPRDFGMPRLPTSAMANFAARSRGLYAFVANLLLIALGNQSKWPPRLVKIYLEDSLSDRLWVDLDECKAFVLNLETALPPVTGDPRGLFTLLCASGPPVPGVQAVLGLNLPSATATTAPLLTPAASLDLAEAVATALHATRTSQSAKVIHGGDPARLVSPRFESGRSAVEGIIVTTLREALSRRSSSSTGLGHSLASSADPSGPSGEVVHTRCLIRTLAMAAGIPEIRSLAAQRLEPWLTNPKLQTLAVGLLAIVVGNCKQGSTSPSDIDTIITVIFRIRQKLLKANIQAAVLENICRLAAAGPTNLAILVKLCMASELPTIAAICEANEQAAKQAAKQQQSQLPSMGPHASSTLASINSPAAKCLVETIRKLCSQSESDEVPSHSDSVTSSINTIAVNAAEAVAKGHTSVSFIFPKLYQRFSSEWIKVVAEVLHDRIVEAITNSNSTSPQFGSLTAHPTDIELVTHTLHILAPTRQLLRDLAKWMRGAFVPVATPTSSVGGGGGGGSGEFLPCAEMGCGILLLDRSVHPVFAESAVTVAQRLWQAGGGQSFGPFTILRYIYAVVHVICQLQMLSATRPSLCDAPAVRKKVTGAPDPVKQHQACVRQLRLYFLRWFKSFVPNLISAAAGHFPAVAPRDAFAQISLLLRRAFFLEVTAPFDIPPTATDSAFSPFYAAEELWPLEQNQRPFVCHLTYVNLPEKLAIHVLRHGLESQWGLVSPPDAAAIVCELIWRSTALSIDNGSESSNFSKLEELIDLLYACCSFCADCELPNEIPEMAYKEPYWKVSMALVALGTHSPKICGAYLWTNYPTVRKLMEMVITNDFTYPPLNASSDATSVESERLNKELEDQMILRLEAYLARPLPSVSTVPQQASSDEETKKDTDEEKRKTVKLEAMELDSVESSLPVVTSVESQLIGQLVQNNPRGVCRCPPVAELAALKRLSEQLGLRRRLCSCRQPDLLLELIITQAPDLPQPWVIQLVESMWQSIDVLPLQCLAEYLLHSSLQRIQAADEKAFMNGVTLEVPAPPTSRRLRDQSTSSMDANVEANVDLEKLGTEGPLTSRRVRPDSTAGSVHASEKLPVSNVGAGQAELNRRRLYNRILERLRLQSRSPPMDVTTSATGQLGPDRASQNLVDNIAEAVLQSFANRLRDPSSLIRRAARYCLTLLAVEDVTTASIVQPTSGPLIQPMEELLIVLQSLINLPGLSVAVDRQQQQQQQHIESLEAGTTTAATTRGMDFLGLILGAILVEDDTTPLMAYVLFLGQLTEIASFVAWRPTINCLSQLLLNRKTLVRSLLESTELLNIPAPNPPLVEGCSQSDMEERTEEFRQTAGFIFLENICRIMALDVDYYCTSASVIPVNEKNSVFVTWSPTRQCPMELEIIESHLVLLSRIPRRFVAASSCSSGSWWDHLLNTWFTCDANGVYSLPSIVPLTSSSTDVMHTKCGLVSLSASNKFSLSPELRSAFLVSGLPQLASAALSDITQEELLQVICNTPALLLDGNMATCLIDCATKLQVKPSTPKQTLAFEKLKTRAKHPIVTEYSGPILTTSRIFVSSNVVAPPVLTPRKPIYTPISPATPKAETAGTSVSKPPMSADTREPPGGSKNLWRTFFSRLTEAAGDFVSQSELFCYTLARVNSSLIVRNRWMQDLVNELQMAHSSLKRGRAVSTAAPLVDVLKSLPNLTSVTYAYSLIRSCLASGLSSSDPKTASRYQKSTEFCINEFEKITFHPLLLERLLLKPLRSLIAKRVEEQGTKSREDATSEALPLTFDQLELRPLEQQMEALTLYGVSFALLSAGDSTDAAWALVRRLILAKIGSDVDIEEKEDHMKKRRYLLEELVHNTSPTILRVCLRNVLREDVRQLHSTFSLDLFSSVLNLPVFSSSMPFVEPHERPDPGCLYSLLHRLESPTEGMRLIAHVCVEASKVPSSLRDQSLVARAPLLDMAFQSSLQPCLHYIEYLAGFLDPPTSLPPDLLATFPDASSIARRLLLCLYLRRPGLLYALKSSVARSFLRTPSASESIPECFEQKEVDRLGPGFLICLSASSDVMREISALSSLALAIHHPRLCLRLLPLIASLSQGRLDTSLSTSSTSSGGSSATGTLPWGKFVARHHIDFYAGLLRFMEVLAFPGKCDEPNGVLFSPEAEHYRYSIDEILSSLIHAAASYPNHAAKMAGGFARRLARLLLAYASAAGWARTEDGLFGDSNGGSNGTRRTRAELAWLAGAMHEFAPLATECALSLPLSILRPSPTASPPNVSPKHGSLATSLQPFIQRLRNPSNPTEVVNIISDLDVLTERKVEFLVYFQSELEDLIIRGASRQDSGCTALTTETSIQPRLLNLLFRLLRHSPQQAHEVLPRVYLPCLEGYGTSAALDHLPEACLLAPHLAPLLLCTAASRLVDTEGAPPPAAIVNAVSATLHRLTLDGVYEACIEHAASGVWNTTTGPKFTLK
ncbi:Integrator complex subunit 1 [Echinococcus granulosus]|uniref:Integrator complex subunit 1 n=1 Tax=Echinococcus granulosus TaxID=6210 RepID=A0A068X0R2_ECHGR|nr:Integrator complex subunit 1 [Echinococcus granulosus]CDS24319.1 integrator complex subunit 1 [Echinococcus granulosus]